MSQWGDPITAEFKDGDSTYRFTYIPHFDGPAFQPPSPDAIPDFCLILDSDPCPSRALLVQYQDVDCKIHYVKLIRRKPRAA